MSEGDTLCLVVQKRLCPGSTFAEVCVRIRAESDFQKQFLDARAILEKQQESEACSTPTWVPSTQVTHGLQYGYTTYTKIGLLTETQFKNLLDQKLPAQLGVLPYQFDEKGLGTSTTKFYPISLVSCLIMACTFKVVVGF